MGTSARDAAAALLGAVLLVSGAHAHPPASQLQRDLDHLRVVGSVLYVAAHPDDENTRLISWLTGARGLHVTYLSLTRGSGGQNLIGAERGDILGVIRTDELAAARRIDGGEQRFTRARDYGYSKSPDEALAAWGHDEVLADVVQVVREVRPDIIVTRFGERDDSHGHHVASAILAREAFALAADPTYDPDGLPPWQARRLLRNESHWRIGPDTDVSGWMQVDVGGQDPRVGASWSELAAASRTMHKSQGFGASPGFGPQPEYFSRTEGDALTPSDDPFGGLTLDWSRFDGGAAVDRLLARASRRFRSTAPERAVPDLLSAHAALDRIEDPTWRDRTRRRVEALIVDLLGLRVEALADVGAVSPGGDLNLRVRALVRRGEALTGVTVTLPDGQRLELGSLRPGAAVTEAATVVVPDDTPLTRPAWLEAAPEGDRYAVPPGPKRTRPGLEPSLVAEVELDVQGRPLHLAIPIQRRWTDRVHGERREDVHVVAPVTVELGQGARYALPGVPLTLPVVVRPSASAPAGIVTLSAPAGTVLQPATLPFDAPAGQAVLADVTVVPGDVAGPVTATAQAGGRAWSYSHAVVDHPHLSPRQVPRPAALQLAPVQLDRGGVRRVAYLPGAGDDVPAALRDLGYDVQLVGLDDLVVGLDHDALVLGVRAFNVHPELHGLQPALHAFAARGGTVIMQYNTSTPYTPLPPIGPTPLQIARDRVTDQDAALVALTPDDPVLSWPNALTPADYAGWVQERGLYFATRWEPPWRPVFQTHDPGEEPLDGALLIAPHGDGHVVYTGLSFFRQLPAGVPGAARLFANLLALGRAP